MIIIVLSLLGLCLGSFVNALVWRLKTKRDWVKERSICVHCGHTLGFWDLIPVLSWLGLKGRCRYCHKPISWQYPVVEASTALLFGVSYIYWPSGWAAEGSLRFGFWLIFLVGFMALIIYDLRWLLLPNKIVYPLLYIALLQTFIVALMFGPAGRVLLTAYWGLIFTGGLFYLLFQLSNGRWIGGGDVKLGAVLGLITGGPLKSILLIFIASLLGSLASLPLLASGRLNKKHQLPFGPFLIVAAILVQLWGERLINLYQRLLI